MTEWNQESFDKGIMKGVTLVDFWAPWCMPCRMQAEPFQKTAEKFPTVQFAKVNVDENENLAIRYHIDAIPAILIFKDGNLVDRALGLHSEEQLVALVKQQL